MFNKTNFAWLIENGYLNEVKHPTDELYLYNYTQTAQFEKIWEKYPEIKECRGLILTKEGNVVARPFSKFFNLEEYGQALPPYSSFEVYDKLDGSLGIIYPCSSGVAVATRGSFTSEQAIWATKYLQEKHTDFVRGYFINNLYQDYTLLVEIIYPQNRIVVCYGDDCGLTLLAGIYNFTGRDLQRDKLELFANLYGFPIVKTFHGITDFKNLREEIKRSNAEGFVVLFDTGLRVKMKYAEYVKLHSLVTNISTVSIWECLKNNINIEEMLKDIPDELFQVVLKEKETLEKKYKNVEVTAVWAYGEVGRIERDDPKERRKAQASVIMKNYKGVSSIIFALLDGKDYSEIIWKMIRPEYRKVGIYSNEEAE